MPEQSGFAGVLADIGSATDEPQLHAAVEAGGQAVLAALTAHTHALTLARAWSQVMACGLAAAIRLVTTDTVAWTWYVSGSVARGEAIPGSDIETLTALDDDVDPDGKSQAMELAAEVHAVLERCGFNSDANGVLASRGRFCRRRSSWSDGIERWCADPAEDRGVVMTGLLADSVAIGRGADDELRAHTLDAARRHPAALRAMLQDATAVRAGIPSRLRVFATHDDTVDIKRAAVEPIVKIARWAAMSAQSGAVMTLERLNDAGTAGTLDADDAAILRDCYRAVSSIRWRNRAAAWIDGQRVDELVSLANLSPQERAALRQIWREVTGIRRKLAFLASAPSFR
jgi:CBS domain-containing protein